MQNIGILGGGQLGKMFLQNAMRYPFIFHVLDPDAQAPCQSICSNFKQGSLNDFQTVFTFGQSLDILTIEIENVQVQALYELEAKGVKVFPQPRVIALIQNKISQKRFFVENNLPTADFHLLSAKDDLKKFTDFLPAVQKLAIGGYDGRGVQILHGPTDFSKAFTQESLLEKKVNIQKEISVIVARNPQGEIKVYDTIEMVFDQKLNLVDYLLTVPSSAITAQAQQIAVKVIESLQMVGVLAVEMFLDKEGNILINEIAPRPHNSGHHTIEACYSSQYDQHIRAITGMPLGDTSLQVAHAAMLNLIGAEGYQGEAYLEGLEELVKEPGVFLHWYGKQQTKPGRKMGHVTLVEKQADQLERLLIKLNKLKSLLKVTSHS